MEKFRSKYRIPTNRIQGYDYGSEGCYFVAVCTKNHQSFLGEITNGAMRLSQIGELAEKFWLDIPNHFPFVVLDVFVIMPNHIHGVLFFDRNKEEPSCRDAIYRVSAKNGHGTGGKTGKHNPMLHNNLGRVLRWYKGRVSFEGRTCGDFAWQERFYDRIIRDGNGLENVRAYIFNNPRNWIEDEYCIT